MPFNTRGYFEGGSRSHCQSVYERIMDGIANHFPAKKALDYKILHIQSKSNSRVIHPDSRGRRGPHPGAWTQTPISAWLASVPSVPVLRNDHSLAQIPPGLLLLDSTRLDTFDMSSPCILAVSSLSNSTARLARHAERVE